MGLKSLCFLFTILLFSSFCYGNDKSVLEVVGHGDCADCAESNIKSSQAFSGLRVTIDCKSQNGESMQTRGEGTLDAEGKFLVALPKEIFENEKLKEECFAKLHSASHTPCPNHNGIESSKLIFKTKIDGKHIFTTTKKLKFSPITCTSATFLPPYKHPKFPKKKFPFYKKPCPPLAPYFKKPLPPPIPIYKPTPKPSIPIYKPTPKPSIPIYKPTPKPPVYEPKPKPPVYKPKPKPPVYEPKPKPPVYEPKPKPPVYKPKPKPPVYEPKPKPPVYKPPTYVKPLLPPVPIYKKPFPPMIPIYKPLPPMIPIYKPLPPFPTIPKKPCPPFPKIPKKYFHHPIFAPWPPHST